MQQDADVRRVCDEIEGAFKGWEAKDRWTGVGVVDDVKDASY